MQKTWETPATIDIVHRRSVIILMIISVLAAIKLAADILIPMAIAAFLVALAWPVKTMLNKHLPQSLSYLGSFVALITVLAFFAGAIYVSASEIIEATPKYQHEFARFWKETKYELAVQGVDTTGKMKLEEIRNIAGQLLLNFHQSLITLTLVAAYVMLTLPEVTSWKGKLRNSLGKERCSKILSASEKIGKSFQHYLVAMVVCGIISALATYTCASLLGLDLAFTWSILAFLLSFIPVIGAFLTVIPPTLLAFFQFNEITTPLTTLLVLGTVHMLVGNIIEPKIQGRMLSLSPLVVLASLSLWGFLWGLPGALLAAPLTHGAIIICNHYDRTRWLARLLSERKMTENATIPRPEPETST